MTVNIITASNSRTTQLYDGETGGLLLVAADGYITTQSSNGSYFTRGGYGSITIKGSLIAQDGYCMNLDVSNTDASLVGNNTIFIGSEGVLVGKGGIIARGSFNTVENHGSIAATGAYAIFFATGYNFISNFGTISGLIGGLDDSTGIINIDNAGTITGDIRTGAALVLDNSGYIKGSVGGGDLADVIDTSAGVINGVVQLGGGTDSYAGGDGVDRVLGGADNDVIDLGGGNDVYYALNGDGKDTLDGGDGIDRYDASPATQAVTVDLSSNTTAGTVGADDIVNFENITGGSAADTLTGDDGANRIDGGMGADILSGGAGNDRLIGGTGTDTITGGAGKDILTGGQIVGGLDSDTFVFRTGDSGVTAATRDTVTDFTDHGRASGTFNTGADLIDLHLIDANSVTAGDQAFSFNTVKGAAFSGAAGSLIWQQFTGFALVSGDTNGDGKADFTIQLNGTHTLFASDLVL